IQRQGGRFGDDADRDPLTGARASIRLTPGAPGERCWAPMPDRPAPLTMLSGPPLVRLENAFVRPYENAVAAARTCYSSKGVLRVGDVSGDGLPDEQKRKRVDQSDRIAESTYQAGHHTTLQHAHFQFIVENVSRHCLWSFLHSHPFYNSEQVSQ